MHHLVLRCRHTHPSNRLFIHPSSKRKFIHNHSMYCTVRFIHTIIYSVSIFSKWYVRLVDSGNGKKQPQAIWTISQPLNWNAIYLIISKLDLSALVLYLIILLGVYFRRDAVKFLFGGLFAIFFRDFYIFQWTNGWEKRSYRPKSITCFTIDESTMWYTGRWEWEESSRYFRLEIIDYHLHMRRRCSLTYYSKPIENSFLLISISEIL